MSTIEKFEKILDLEQTARLSKASLALRPCGTPLFAIERMHQGAEADRRKLYAAIDALTPAEAQAFGHYRITKEGQTS